MRRPPPEQWLLPWPDPRQVDAARDGPLPSQPQHPSPAADALWVALPGATGDPIGLQFERMHVTAVLPGSAADVAGAAHYIGRQVLAVDGVTVSSHAAIAAATARAVRAGALYCEFSFAPPAAAGLAQGASGWAPTAAVASRAAWALQQAEANLASEAAAGVLGLAQSPSNGGGGGGSEGRALSEVLLWADPAQELGLRYREAGGGDQGEPFQAIVSEVALRSPAAAAGLLPGDIIVAIGSTCVDGPGDVRDAMAAFRARGAGSLRLIVAPGAAGPRTAPRR
eukprot:TRINITY_DN27770_c0_g1_i2.p1 TRINITY_DN27770_c0_g1~~TRINITY_DN27770_c0_g1_i2.p1  ORF type:complete len:282 (+),score=66.78 TRINITY_DN27770_c0_g1_i2:89-934(+)